MPHKKSSKHRKTKRRRHRGGFYGAGGPILDGGQGPAGMAWDSKQEVPAFEVDGARIPVNLKGGGRKKRKGKKSTKRRMRGGTKFGVTYASYQGEGSRGLANVSGGTHTPGAPQEGRFNNNGAEPSKFGGFGELRPAQL